MSINTGFSWVRIDKGTFHCNFRYLDDAQVHTVINYLSSYYAYHNITFGVVDLGAAGVLPETGDHYRPSGGNPSNDYYYLVELHRHGTIIPQGCIEIMKIALNGLAQHTIIPESVFIQHMGSDVLTVDDVADLVAIRNNSAVTQPDITWDTSDSSIISIDPDGSDDTKCKITALSPGAASITASVEVEEMPVILFDRMPKPAGGYVGTTTYPKIYQYTGATTTLPYGTFQQNNYYECVWDATLNSGKGDYKWVDSDFDGQPVDVTYTDTYIITVRTFIKITNKTKQKLCLYQYLPLHATTPSTGLVINWQASTEAIGFDPSTGSTGPDVNVVGLHTGSGYVKVVISDAYGTYMDEMPLTIYGIAVTPKEMKIVVGSTKHVIVTKDDILNRGEYDSNPILVEWASSSETIAKVDSTTVSDPVHDHAEAIITAQTGGVAYITAIAEDPIDGKSYQDSVKVTVGNVAIDVPSSTTIWLLSSTHTITLTAELTTGFEIAADGWTSSNSSVVSVGTPSGTGNNTVVVTGLAEGTSIISVKATAGAAEDTDQILIKVVNADYVTEGEMVSYTHGLYSGHGMINWDLPTGEEGTFDVPDDVVELVTEEEVTDMVEDLFTPENSEESSEEEDSEESSGD